MNGDTVSNNVVWINIHPKSEVELREVEKKQERKTNFSVYLVWMVHCGEE